MNIGILTYHWVANFGANLQTLSTYNYFKKKGYSPIIINWIPEDLEEIYNSLIPKEQLNEHKIFVETYLNTTNICRNDQDIANAIKENNITKVIIGSDAVLTYKAYLERIILTRKGPKYFKPAIDSDFPNPFWGSFKSLVPEVQIVLMSASAQNTNYKKIVSIKRKLQFKKHLQNFNKITVRDIWTQKMIQYLTNGKIIPVITPDPVFGFNQNHENYIEKDELLKKYHLPENYLLICIDKDIFSNDFILQIEEKFSKEGFVCFELPKPKGYSGIPIKNKINYPISPIDWYYLIKYSKGYIGELMHPLLVSLHNSVPFFSIDNYGFYKKGNLITSSSKIYSILKKFDFLSNYHPVQSKDISVEKILSGIIDFNQAKCAEKSAIIYEEYSAMMKIINDDDK